MEMMFFIYLFDLNQLENLHETVNLIIQFFASTQQLFQVEYIRLTTWHFQFRKGKFKLFIVVHHIHHAHQFLQSSNCLTPMLFDNCGAFGLMEFLIIVAIKSNCVHLMQSRTQIVNLNFTINIFIVVNPTTMLLKLLVKWSFHPVCLLKYPEKSVKMDFFY